MPNPFSLGGAFDNPFDQLNMFPRGRPAAAYPPLSDPDTETAIQSLTRGTLSGLGYVGSTLDKLTGARALRGLAAGKGREALSVLPGSDVLGLTSEEDTTSMDDLLRQHLGYDPSKGNWAERNLLGPGLEIAADPGTWFGGIGAITRLGKLASKAAPVARSLDAVRAGQRSLHPLVGAAEYGAQKLGLSTPASPVVQTAAANLAEMAGKGVGKVHVGIRRTVPLVAPVEDFLAPYAKKAELTGRAWFEPEAGFTTNEPTQQASREVRAPRQKELGQDALRRAYDLDQERKALLAQGGVAPEEANRFLAQLSEGLEPSLPRGTYGPTMTPAAEAGIRALAAKNVQFGRNFPTTLETGVGFNPAELTSETNLYNLRQSYQPPGAARRTGIIGRIKGAMAKQFPVEHPSLMRRNEALQNVEGGRMAIEDLAIPSLAGPAPTLRPSAVRAEILQRQLDQYHENRGLPWRNIPAGPVSPDELATFTQRAEGMRRYLRSLPPEKVMGGLPGGGRLPIFGVDPIADSLLRVQRAIGRRTSGEALFDVMRRAHPMARGLPEDVPIKDILQTTKLNTEEGLKRALNAVGFDDPTIMAHLQAATIASPTGSIDVPAELRGLLGNRAIPAEEARAATKLLPRWQAPEEWRPILSALDASLGAFKTGAYSIWPGSFVRNIGSGKQQNLFMGGMSPLSAMHARHNAFRTGRAVDLGIPDLAHLTPEQQRIALGREIVAYPHLSGHNQGTIGEVVGMDAPSAGTMIDPLSIRQGYWQTLAQLPRSLRAKGIKGLADVPAIGQQMNQIAEERLRIPEYMHLRSKGFTPDRAAQVVKDTHFDYGALTTGEKQVFKRLAPFYTYSRFNIPKQIGQAITRPATIGGPIRFSGMLQGQEEGQGYVPEYLRSGLALPLGSLMPGTERYLSALGLPLEETFGRLKVSANPLETATKTGEGLLAMLRPGIRAPLEMLTGKQFFSGRNLKDLHIGNIENFLSGGNETAGQLISELAGASPAGRGLSTLNKFVDPRKYAGGLPAAGVALGLPFFSGLRVSDVDTEKWKAIDARNQLERELQASQNIKEHRDFFATREAREAGQITPAEAYALRTYNALKARAKAAAEEQRRVGVQLR